MRSILIIGLGNPGEQFGNTRHNLGKIIIATWIDRMRIAGVVGKMAAQESVHAQLQEIMFNDTKITILFPDVFMNDSGKAVAQYLRYHEMDPKNILVIHDDLELPIGEIKYQESGSAHGHNGMRSIHDFLGNTDIAQLRIGIGRPNDGMPIEKFVLGKFTEEEQTTLQEKQEEMLDAITTIIEQRLSQE